jgi:hypothetical protein
MSVQSGQLIWEGSPFVIKGALCTGGYPSDRLVKISRSKL